MNNINTQLRPKKLTPHIFLAKILDVLRQICGGDRFNNLYQAIKKTLESLNANNQDISLLDYGCGVMSISSKLQKEGIVTDYIGLDIYPAPKDENEPWCNYLQVKKNWAVQLKKKYDAAIITDVLHHVETEEERIAILQELAQVANLLVIKDHFEYGFYSRQLLRLIDWIGNYAYGVKIPTNYFTMESWEKLISTAGLEQIEIQNGVKIHTGLFGYLIPSRYHFIAILRKTF
jgi:hypothetical protein